MSTLEKAIELAARVHAGVTDKAGAPYILHPLRVMMKMDSIDERIVAVLHDVVEDTPITFDDLREMGFSEAVIAGVASVTLTEEEEAGKSDETVYMSFIRRAAADPIGRKVKLADLEDNMDITRIANPTEKDRNRVAKYCRAAALIKSLPEA